MKTILILILSISLTGCFSFLEKKPDVAISTPKVVQIDPKLLEPCKSLPEAVDIQTMGDNIDLYAYIAELYGVCAIKQRNSITILKQFGNIK